MKSKVSDDDLAMACGCGSVKFNLTKSGKIECAKCQAKKKAWAWYRLISRKRVDAILKKVDLALNEKISA